MPSLLEWHEESRSPLMEITYIDERLVAIRNMDTGACWPGVWSESTGG